MTLQFVERFGIREEARTKTEARKAWETTRDDFVDRSADGPWIFAWRGAAVVVTARPHGWEYTILRSADLRDGRYRASCFYQADTWAAAMVVALTALAQAMWSPDAIVDDEAEFRAMCLSARVTDHEARDALGDFVRVTAYWRAHRAEQAA